MSSGLVPTKEVMDMASLGWLDGADKKLLTPRLNLSLVEVENMLDTVIWLRAGVPRHWSPVLIFLFKRHLRWYSCGR